MIYLTNAFSLNMLPGILPKSEDDYLGSPARIEVIPCDSLGAKEALESRHHKEGWTSAVGHPSTATIFSQELGLDVPCQRTTVSLKPGDRLVVGQYSGPRLEEGATTLPEGASIRWFEVDIRQYESWEDWEGATVFSGPHEGE